MDKILQVVYLVVTGVLIAIASTFFVTSPKKGLLTFLIFCGACCVGAGVGVAGFLNIGIMNAFSQSILCLGYLLLVVSSWSLLDLPLFNKILYGLFGVFLSCFVLFVFITDLIILFGANFLLKSLFFGILFSYSFSHKLLWGGVVLPILLWEILYTINYFLNNFEANSWITPLEIVTRGVSIVCILGLIYQYWEQFFQRKVED